MLALAPRLSPLALAARPGSGQVLESLPREAAWSPRSPRASWRPSNARSPRMLYRMKRGTVRPKDWGDAEMLRRRFQLEDG